MDAAIAEQAELFTRYAQAKADATTRGTRANLEDFEAALKTSRAVISRSMTEFLRLIGSEFEGYATYYQLASSSVRIQSGELRDSQRQAADAIFFTNYQFEIRFAALSLDSGGLSNYGECSWVFREDMIGHRASVFEENTTLYYLKNGIKDAGTVPRGYRATWADREKLGVAKLASKIDSSTASGEYSDLLIRQDLTSGPDDFKKDDFIEVHIFGPMTIRTIEEVSFAAIPTTISKTERKLRQAMEAGIREKVVSYAVLAS